MPTYVTLMNWTDQGIRTVRDTVNRRGQADELAQKHGANIEEVYWTVGPYDIVAIVQAPDDESVTSTLLELGSAGPPKPTPRGRERARPWCWNWARRGTLGPRRFGPTTANRCRGSSRD